MAERITLEESQLEGLDNKGRHAMYMQYYCAILSQMKDSSSGITSFELPEVGNYWISKGANLVIEIANLYKVPFYVFAGTKNSRIDKRMEKFPQIPVVFIKDKNTGDINSAEVLKEETLNLLSDYLNGKYK